MPRQKRDAEANPKTTRKKPALTRAKRILRANLPVLRERYHVRSLGIFGSYLRGEQRERSDLDILVEYDRAPTLFQLVDLEEHLSKLTGIKVDLVMKDALKPKIGERILAEVVPI